MADAEAFAVFVAARYPALVRTAFLFVGDRGHAEDLAQSALLRTYSHWAGLRSEDAAEAYARTTMARLAGRWSRRRWSGEIPSETTDASSDKDQLAGRVEALDLFAALGALPWSQRAVLVLRYFEDLSEADTAAILRCSAGTVKSRTSRALTSLRARLGPDVIDDEIKQSEETARHG